MTKRPHLQSPSHKEEIMYTLNLKIIPTTEIFSMKNVSLDTTIKKIKEDAELVTGIPYSLQRLSYLDACDLLNESSIKDNEIINGGVINMRVWSEWSDIVHAAATNDSTEVFKLGVTKFSNYSSPNVDRMSEETKNEWIVNRAFVSLYIAAHRGYFQLVQKLIKTQPVVNRKTSLGRTALHVAASQGHGSIVDLLLENEANVDALDIFDDNALTIANRFGQKGCERHLFLFRWQQRAKKVKPQTDFPMFAHQYFDSGNSVWLNGRCAQRYVAEVLPPGEYEGTNLNAKSRIKQLPPDLANAKSRLSGKSFEEWRQIKENQHKEDIVLKKMKKKRDEELEKENLYKQDIKSKSYEDWLFSKNGSNMNQRKDNLVEGEANVANEELQPKITKNINDILAAISLRRQNEGDIPMFNENDCSHAELYTRVIKGRTELQNKLKHGIC